MIHKPFDQIEKADIDALVANEVAESKTLEYKEKINGWGDDDKKEFLADVAALANTEGGDLLFGVKERRPTGIAEDACGVAVEAAEEIARIEAIVREGIAPRIPSVQVKAINGFSRGHVILIRIGKSWAAPHMVNFKVRHLFWARNSTGKFHLDIAGIRSAFLGSETLSKRIEAFVTERVSKISVKETPIPLEKGPTVVMHLIPVSTLGQQNVLSPKELAHLHGETAPLTASGYSNRVNLDGFLTYVPAGKELTSSSYTQFFRNGSIEAVSTDLMGEHDGKKVIPYTHLEGELIQALNRCLSVYKRLLVSPPMELRLTMIGVRGYEMATRAFFSRRATPIERDTVFLPGVLLEDISQRGDKLLRPVFDTLWNACGYQECPNYNDEGIWQERRT